MNANAFLTSCVVHKKHDVLLFAAEPAEKPGESMFYAVIGTNLHVYDSHCDWAAQGMAAVRYPQADDWLVLAIGPEGQFWELPPASPAKKRTGCINESISGVTCVATIGESLWICGMDRIAWERTADGRWIDRSAPPARIEEGVIGFTALAQAAPGMVVAVGWRGEIWMRDAQGWQAQDSGTNANFNAVSVGADGQIVVVGDAGKLAIGHRDQWTVVPTDPSFNLQGVCHFGGEVFVCSDFEIFRWTGDALVHETRFADDDRPGACMNLLSGKDTIISQGERDIFRFSDGVWSRVY